ncbi:hypothetical protein [uncultured Nitratireductor sp.]|uniref:hypothetical protein n=1 Tax=uncultured Nitratireductor sp. TaxID=520953 RepID=UPI0025EF4075|nr:hypothetical protein [uncultured Nitratireductor sp.]
MFLRVLLPLSAVPLILAGCVSDGDNAWVKDDTARSDTQQALAECKYEAEAATIGIGANDHPKTWGEAVGDGIGDAVIQAMDENELIKSCMRAKGFRR